MTRRRITPILVVTAAAPEGVSLGDDVVAIGAPLGLEVIGVVSQIESTSGGSDGVGFAIPSNTAPSVVAQILGTSNT